MCLRGQTKHSQRCERFDANWKGGIMLQARALIILAALAATGTGCTRYRESMASGDVITAADAAKTVVLHVENLSTSPMELRTINNGRSLFVGSVSAQDTTNILLDPSLFPTGSLYLAAI